MKKKTLTAEVITLYRVFERNEWGDDYEYFYRTEKKARAVFSNIVDSCKNKAGNFRFEGTLSVGDYNDYYEAVREARKADDSPLGCGTAAIPPWDELAKRDGSLICMRLFGDIEMFCEKVTAVKMADGTIHRLEEVRISK